MTTMTLNRARVWTAAHGLWWLLPLPAVLALILAMGKGGEPVGPQAWRLGLVGAFAMAIFGLRQGVLGARSHRLLKEFRLLLPGALLAIVGPGVAVWMPEADRLEVAMGCVLFGGLFMGAAAFGREFEGRTMGTLLCSPVPRSTLFLEKWGAMAGTVAVAYASFALFAIPSPVIRFGAEDLAIGAAMAAVPVFSGPWLSLLSRSSLAGMVFTGALPMVVVLAMFGVSAGLEARGYQVVRLESLIWSALPVYLVGTFFLGWRAFARLTVRDGGDGGRAEAGMHPVGRPLDWLITALVPARSGLGQLVRKELRLHVLSWVIAAVTVGLWLLWITVRALAGQAEPDSVWREVQPAVFIGGLLGSIGLIGTGAACVAEERQLGTLDWQLTQPVSLRMQWWVKVAMAFVLGVGLSVVLPALLVWLSFTAEEMSGAFKGVEPIHLLAYGGAIGLGLGSSILASSISRSTMKATAVAVGLGAVVAAGIGVGMEWAGEAMNEATRNPAPDWIGALPALSMQAGVDLLKGLGMMSFLALLGTLLGLAGRHFRTGIPSWSRVLVEMVAVGVGACLLVRGLGEAGIVVLHWVQ